VYLEASVGVIGAPGNSVEAVLAASPHDENSMDRKIPTIDDLNIKYALIVD
jgi:hypothetical protein